MHLYIETTYENPLIEEPWADPAVAGPDRDGWYWTYATDDEHEPLPRRQFKVARSRDLVRWETHPEGARLGALPAPIPNYGRHRASWAPDVRRLGPESWVLYGSLCFDDHEPDGPNGHGIFVARSTGPTGFAEPKVLRRGPGFSVIDPCHYRSNRLGRSFLYWGSGCAPIYGQELTESGLDFAPGSAPRVVLHPNPNNPAERLWEGVHVIEHPEDGHPIMIASSACTWVGPYRAHSFRAGDHPLDPFAPNLSGLPLLAENAVWGLCGQVFVLTDAIGQHWIFYHAVREGAVIPGTEDIEHMGRRGVPLRQLCMDRLLFDSAGHPYVAGGSPSSTTKPGPVVRKRF